VDHVTALAVDVHQHLWSEPFLEALRARREAPCLDGWTLFLDGEPPYEVNPAHHDIAARARDLASDGFDLGLVSLSSPLGIEWLAPEQARPLLDAYHQGARELPACFAAWSAVCLSDPDLDQLARELDLGSVGLQLPATALATPQSIEAAGVLLELLVAHDKPLFVHPGDVAPQVDAGPAWWPAVVPYVSQMHASWWAFAAARPSFPELRVCFALLAGLAPVHRERYSARGGERLPVDRNAFLETSSYGAAGVDAVVRAVGVDALVVGSDRPYATPYDAGGALGHVLRTANPGRLLGAAATAELEGALCARA
jgi:hypothetical protein